MVTQLDVYTEEKFEDEEDMRERASNLVQGGSRNIAPELTSTLEELVNLTRSRTEDYENVIRILKALILVFQLQGERYDYPKRRNSLTRNRHSPLAI
jgi:diaphanous 1